MVFLPVHTDYAAPLIFQPVAQCLVHALPDFANERFPPVFHDQYQMVLKQETTVAVFAIDSVCFLHDYVSK